MRNILLTTTLLLGLMASSYAESDLKPVMKEIGASFKTLVKAARTQDTTDATKLVLEKLKGNITTASTILPTGIDPTDTDVVDRYKSLLNGLLELSIKLEDSFLTNPFNRAEALAILGEMNALRKKGHAIFR